MFRVWRPKDLEISPQACPECGTESDGEYCGECGSLLHPDHIQFRRDERFKVWAAELEAMLR